VVGVLFGLGAVGLIGLPYVGTYLGHAQIDEGATLVHVDWVQPLLAVASGISAGAILRAGARVFLGWGERTDALLSQQPKEEPERTHGGTSLLLGVTAAALVLGLAVSLVPGLGQRAEAGAERFRDRAGYSSRVLHGQPMHQAARQPFAIEHTGPASVGYGIASGCIALLVAVFGLWRQRLPHRLRVRSMRLARAPLSALKEAHSGVVGDYVMWITLGTALIGGVWAVTLR
jgi:multicomponent Na+:H+ antiporter subunit D